MRSSHARIGGSALAACAALTLAAAVHAAAPIPGARYAGATDEGLRVALRVARNGRSIARFEIRYLVACDNGAVGKVSTEIFDVPVGDGGRFSYSGTYRKRVDRSTNHVRLRGRIRRSFARGTFSLTATARPDGSPDKVHCFSDHVSWRAGRKR